MYNRLKKLALKIVPKKFLLKNEHTFRSIYGFAYRGSKHNCAICDKGLNRFISLPDGDDLCPFCGSRSRTRHLYDYLIKNDLVKGDVLHFSPSRSLYRVFKKMRHISYITSDFEDEFIAEFKYDITQIPREVNSFDLIICYHILEHIPGDQKAMQELSRVLKQDGSCLIQTPFKDGDIYEDPTITTPEEKLKAFGQEDHVRIYSVEGLKTRLLKNGFSEVQEVAVRKDALQGFSESTFLIAKK
ncbi:MAG: methyltransferase domain-containing protein [Gilvibacter sp.]